MSSENLKVYRYNFRPQFTAILHHFAKVHQYDSCSDFKDAFSKWEETHCAFIQEETSYLSALGYSGNFRNKVFKSARYYFRKKDGSEFILGGGGDVREDDLATVTDLDVESFAIKKIKKSTNPRKKYTSIDYQLSTKMAEYLEHNSGLKPSDGFARFCEIYRKEVDVEISRLEEEEEEEGGGLLKIKKTFKNKHFNKKQEILQQLRNDNL
jgi:hypothetical protein